MRHQDIFIHTFISSEPHLRHDILRVYVFFGKEIKCLQSAHNCKHAACNYYRCMSIACGLSWRVGSSAWLCNIYDCFTITPAILNNWSFYRWHVMYVNVNEACNMLWAMTKYSVSAVRILTCVASRCAAVVRRRAAPQAVGWYFQPKPLSADLGDHAGPLLVRLARAEARGAVGPQPLLHPRLLPVARQTHLPLGQAPRQAARLVNRCKYADDSHSLLASCKIWPLIAFEIIILIDIKLLIILGFFGMFEMHFLCYIDGPLVS